jgi:hypothetical protein
LCFLFHRHRWFRIGSNFHYEAKMCGRCERTWKEWYPDGH